MDGIYWIYCIENKTNGKKYIGKTDNPKLRWKRHMSMSKRDGEKQYIHYAINKYGVDNFWFGCIDYCFSEQEALDQEMFWIKFHQTKGPKGYNRTDGGEGASGYKHTEDAKIKMTKLAQQRVGALNSFYGKTHSLETILVSTGENNKQAKLTKLKVSELLDLYYTGNYTEENLAKIFFVKRQTVNDILRGKRWKHVDRNIDRINQVKNTNRRRL